MPATTAVPPRRRLKVFVQGQIVIPDWVDDLDSYCRWRLSGDAPECGEMAFLDSGIWVDLSREEFLTHNQVKAVFDFAIMSVVQPALSGRYVPDGNRSTAVGMLAPAGFLHQFRAARPEVGLESTCRQITGLRCPDFLVPAAWPRLGPIPPARLGRAA